MSPIVIVTGSPGTGKTTVAAILAKGQARGLHLPADVFFSFPAHPIPPYRPAARDQNNDIIIALARTAAAFAALGYDVFMDGIFGPWFVPLLAEEMRAAKTPLEYVVLGAPVETALRRVQARQGSDMHHVVRQMHAEFGDLGSYVKHAIDTAELTPEAVASEFLRRRPLGDFRIDLDQTTSHGVT